MTDPKTKKTKREPLEKPAASEELDGSRDMFEDADHMGVPLVFDEEGNVVSGRDPRRG